MARDVDQLSRATQARFLGPAGSTSSPRRLAPSSDILQGRPALPGDSRLGRWPAFSTSCPGDSGPCLRSCGLKQMSRVTWGLFPGSAVSTSSPVRLGPGSDGLRGQPTLPSHSRLGLRAHGVEQYYRVTRARAECPWGRPAFPGVSGPGPIAREVISSPEGTVLGSVVSRCRPVLPGDSGSCRGTAGSTNSPGRLAIESEGPRCRPALLGDSCSCLRARGVDQLSQAIGFGSDGPRGRPAGWRPRARLL